MAIRLSWIWPNFDSRESRKAERKLNLKIIVLKIHMENKLDSSPVLKIEIKSCNEYFIKERENISCGAKSLISFEIYQIISSIEKKIVLCPIGKQ